MQLSTWNKVEFKVRLHVAAGVTRDTVPEMTPANSVSVEIVTEVIRVVSVTRVVSVEIQVVLTVMDSLMTDSDVGWLKGETEKSLASLSGPQNDGNGDRCGTPEQLRMA